MAIDFEAEGLLDGLDDAKARDGRLELLGELAEAGCTLDQLKAAVAEDRLSSLPLELVFTRGLHHSLADVVRETGLDEGFIRRNYLALGLPLPPFDEPALDDDDMESWRMLRALFDAGISEDQILQMARPSGRWAAQLVDVLRQVFVEAFLEPGDTERDFSLRLARLSEELVPTIGPLTERPVRLHLRERVRHDVINFTEVTSGGLPDMRHVGICFADLVEFTRLSERLGPDELGQITARLERLAGEVAEPPIRLIKLIGDAAMLVSPEVPGVVDAAKKLVEAAEQDGSLPRLRAGIAAGEALNRGGDWYGSPVNLASRITDIAEPGSVLASQAVVEATTERHRWTALGGRRLKGFDQEVGVYLLKHGAPSRSHADS
jgi:adenylate cyclase